jgi:hypothetical protein
MIISHKESISYHELIKKNQKKKEKRKIRIQLKQEIPDLISIRIPDDLKPELKELQNFLRPKTKTALLIYLIRFAIKTLKHHETKTALKLLKDL